MKKTFSVLLLLVAAGSMVFASGGQETSGSTGESAEVVQPLSVNTMPIVEPGSVTLTFAVQDVPAQYVSLPDAPVWKLVQEITGVNIDWQLSPDGNAYDTSMKTRLAAGQELPDMLRIPGTVSDAVKYAQEGVLAPISGLIDTYAPNTQRLYKANPSIEASSRTPEGEIYFLINYLLGNENSNLTMLRADWLRDLGLSDPTTKEEWYNVLKTVKESDINNTGRDDIIAFGGQIDYFLSAFDMTSRGGYYWYDDKGKVYFYAMHPNFKEYLTFVNRLYEEQLLDPSYGAAQSRVNELRVQNKVFASAAWAAEADFRDSELKAAGYPKADWKYLIPPASQNGSLSFSTLNTARNTQRYGISKDSKNPDVAMRVYDFIYASEQGTRITLCGIEGEDWYVDGGGKLQFTDLALRNPDYNIIGYLRTFKGAFVTPMDLQTTEFNDARIGGKFAINLQLIQDSGGNAQYPVIVPTADEQEQEAILFTDIKSYIDEMIIKFVTGNEPLASFDKFIATLETLNIETLTQVYQQQYDRYTGK
jgi:putative aldouronate transport system substrate-binding protein